MEWYVSDSKLMGKFTCWKNLTDEGVAQLAEMKIECVTLAGSQLF